MNYCTLTIDSKKIGLKFGMASFRYLSEGKLVEGKSFNGNEINEIGISHILYSGYYNNCLVKDAEPELTFEDFVNYVENSLIRNNDEIMNAMKVWSENDFIKQAQPTTETPKKKSSPGKTSKRSASVK